MTNRSAASPPTARSTRRQSRCSSNRFLKWVCSSSPPTTRVCSRRSSCRSSSALDTSPSSVAREGRSANEMKIRPQAAAWRQAQGASHGRTPSMCKSRLGRNGSGLSVLLVISALAMPSAANAAEPIRVGMTMALTGGVAPIGKQVLAGLQIWRDDVNAKGGVLGRPVQLVFYDDQSNPANVPALYTKLIDVDKVDLLIGPYATNMVAPVIPLLMQSKKTTIGILANAANSKFHYDQYFSMLPTGPEPKKSFAEGFFQLAAAQ